MIKHSLKEDVVYISIENVDFAFRIPSKKIGKTIQWRVGAKDAEPILIKDVSAWTLQLFTKKITDEKYINQFKSIVEEYAPVNSINWKDTLMAVKLQNDYNSITAKNIKAVEKISEDEILSSLTQKYNVD